MAVGKRATLCECLAVQYERCDAVSERVQGQAGRSQVAGVGSGATLLYVARDGTDDTLDCTRITRTRSHRTGNRARDARRSRSATRPLLISSRGELTTTRTGQPYMHANSSLTALGTPALS